MSASAPPPFMRHLELTADRSYVVCIEGFPDSLFSSANSKGYSLSVVVTDFAATAFTGHFSLESLRDSLEDTEPDAAELVSWLQAAIDSNTVVLHHDGSRERTYLLASYTFSRDFHVKLRLPPRGYLTHQDEAEAKLTAYATGASLVDIGNKLRQHSSEQQQRIDALERAMQALQVQNRKLQEEVQLTRQSMDLAGAGPASGSARAPARYQPQGSSRAAAVAGGVLPSQSLVAPSYSLGQAAGMAQAGTGLPAQTATDWMAAGTIKIEEQLPSVARPSLQGQAIGGAPIKVEGGSGPTSTTAGPPIKQDGDGASAAAAAAAAAAAVHRPSGCAATQGDAGPSSAAAGQEAGGGGGAGGQDVGGGEHLSKGARNMLQMQAQLNRAAADQRASAKRAGQQGGMLAKMPRRR